MSQVIRFPQLQQHRLRMHTPAVQAALAWQRDSRRAAAYAEIGLRELILLREAQAEEQRAGRPAPAWAINLLCLTIGIGIGAALMSLA
jgi:hypothetical protein